MDARGSQRASRLDDIGNPDADLGSPAWARWFVQQAKSARHDLDVDADRLRKILYELERYDAAGALGIVSFDVLCATYLQLGAEDVEAIRSAKRGETLRSIQSNAPISWPQRISAAWQKSVEGILETGRLLIEAKAALPHGSFLKMVEEELPFKENTARRLMAIASDTRLSNRAHAPDLPPSWNTLYELTKLDDETWTLAEQKGLIRADVQRNEIVALRRGLAADKETGAAPVFDAGSLISRLHNEILDGLRRCSASERKWVISDLRALLNTLEHWRETS